MYSRADLTVDTARLTVARSVERVEQALHATA
jgi:hypothetical protein